MSGGVGVGEAGIQRRVGAGDVNGTGVQEEQQHRSHR